MTTEKSKLEILIIPIVITIIGIISTCLITNMQIKNAETLSKAQIESTEKTIKSDQQIKIIEIFSEKITSKDLNEREIAVRILGALDTELAEKMMTAIVQSSNSDTLIRNIAKDIKDEIQRGYSYVVVGSFSSLDKARVHVKILLDKEMTYPIKIFNNGKNIFAVCINGQLSNKDAITIKKTLKEKFKIEDIYIKTSKIWEEINYE